MLGTRASEGLDDGALVCTKARRGLGQQVCMCRPDNGAIITLSYKSGRKCSRLARLAETTLCDILPLS